MKNKILLLILLFTCVTFSAKGQNYLQKIEGEGIFTSDEVFVNNKGEKYAYTFNVAFHKHILVNSNRTTGIGSINISQEFPELIEKINSLESNRGLREIKRAYPVAIPDDTLRTNRFGEIVSITDLSKIFRFEFNDVQSLADIKYILQSDLIRYIEPPEVIFLTSNFPDDPYFDLQWPLKLLEAEKVFDITMGSEDIVIGISDVWTSDDTYGVHEELEGRIPAYQFGKWVPGGPSNSSHGPRVAAIAAAKTNNDTGIASLGSNFQVVPARTGAFGLNYLLHICSNPPSTTCNEFPDVINMSWTDYHTTSIKNAVEDLLNLGVVMVGTSVNDIWDKLWRGQTTLGEPFIPYPASYNFPQEGHQVISVTATQLTDNVGNLDVNQPIDPFQLEERFAFQDLGTPDEYIFNYGLSNDPLTDPDEAFTDVAAPSMRIFTAAGEQASNDYKAIWGATSEAAPLVSSIAGLLLSVNPDLTVSEVYDIITSTTDYDNIVVPPDATTFYHPDGIRKYNKYIGYGRVNAYRAVLAAVPKITDHVTSNDTWSGYVHLENNINIDQSSILTIEPGTTVLLDESVNLTATPGSQLIAEGTEEEPIRFIRADPNEAWGTVNLNSSEANSIKWALFDGGHTNLTIASQNNTIEHSTFRNASIRNISSWHNQEGSGTSNAVLSYVLVENSNWTGIMAQFVDLDISNTTIRDNNGAGLYVTSATVFPFHHNEIIDNGSTFRDGIEVMSSGSVTMQENFNLEGFNKVSGNGDDQISSYGSLGMGNCLGIIGQPPLYGGYNHISGVFSGSRYLVNNLSSSTVFACYNWWGESSVNPNMFNGDIEGLDWSLTSDPTTSQNPGSGGQVPIMNLETTEESVQEQLATTYDEQKTLLEQAETQGEVRDRLHILYQLATIAGDRSPQIRDQFLQLTYGASLGENEFFTTRERNRTMRNLSTVLHGKLLLLSGDYTEAENWMINNSSNNIDDLDKLD